VEQRSQTLDEVRSRVAEDVYAQRERRQLRRALDGLREQYEVRVASAPGTPG